jgi:hypothetical protein
MTKRDHLAHVSIDVIDETSAHSVRARDAPGWTIGRDHPTTHRVKWSASASTQRERKRILMSAANKTIARRFIDDALLARFPRPADDWKRRSVVIRFGRLA